MKHSESLDIVHTLKEILNFAVTLGLGQIQSSAWFVRVENKWEHRKIQPLEISLCTSSLQWLSLFSSVSINPLWPSKKIVNSWNKFPIQPKTHQSPLDYHFLWQNVSGEPGHSFSSTSPIMHLLFIIIIVLWIWNDEKNQMSQKFEKKVTWRSEELHWWLCWTIRQRGPDDGRQR